MIQQLYEPFRKWSENGSVWIFSDPHFDDIDTKIMNPNWISPQEHIDKINSKVYKNDTLICLGDCGNLEWFKKLKCKNLILIKGNHDDKGNNFYKNIFNEVYEGALFISSKILLSHEPIYGIPFALNIHGHVHNGKYEYIDYQNGRHINLASDVTNWELFNLGQNIKKGIVSFNDIHRLTIDNQINKKSI